MANAISKHMNQNVSWRSFATTRTLIRPSYRLTPVYQSPCLRCSGSTGAGPRAQNKERSNAQFAGRRPPFSTSKSTRSHDAGVSGWQSGHLFFSSFLWYATNQSVKARSPKPGHAAGKLATACRLTQASIGDR